MSSPVWWEIDNVNDPKVDYSRDLGEGRLGRSWGLSPARLCWSSAHLVQCGSDEPSLTWTQIWVWARMPDYSLNWTARFSANQYVSGHVKKVNLILSNHLLGKDIFLFNIKMCSFFFFFFFFLSKMIHFGIWWLLVTSNDLESQSCIVLLNKLSLVYIKPEVWHLVARLRICWIPCRVVKFLQKKGVSWIWHLTAFDGAPVLGLWVEWSTPLLTLLLDPLWLLMVVPIRISSMGQIVLFKNYSYLIGILDAI